MYVSAYPVPIDTDSFWRLKDEHASMILYGDYNKVLLKRLKNIKPCQAEKFGYLSYAFIFINNDKLDTIYANNELNVFMIKNDKNDFQYYCNNNQALIDKSIINQYPFFNDCW